MHCVARVSVKFKAIFRAHRFFLLIVIDHHWWTLDEEVIIHRWTRYGGVIVDGRRDGHTGGVEKGSFFFSRLLCSEE